MHYWVISFKNFWKCWHTDWNSFSLSSQSALPEQVNIAAVHETCELSPQKLHDFSVNFAKHNKQDDTSNTEHGKEDSAHETIRKVEHGKNDSEHETSRKVDGYFKGKGHQLEDLTSKSLCIKPPSFVISTSLVMRDAVSESKCGGCGKSGKCQGQIQNRSVLLTYQRWNINKYLKLVGESS